MQPFTFSSNLSKYADPQGGGRLWHECLDTRHASWWAGTWFTGWSTVILTSQDVRIINSCCFSIHFLLHPLLVTLTNYTSRHPQIIQALSYRRSVHIQTFTIRKTKRFQRTFHPFCSPLRILRRHHHHLRSLHGLPRGNHHHHDLWSRRPCRHHNHLCFHDLRTQQPWSVKPKT